MTLSGYFWRHIRIKQHQQGIPSLILYQVSIYLFRVNFIQVQVYLVA